MKLRAYHRFSIFFFCYYSSQSIRCQAPPTCLKLFLRERVESPSWVPQLFLIDWKYYNCKSQNHHCTSKSSKKGGKRPTASSSSLTLKKPRKDHTSQNLKPNMAQICFSLLNTIHIFSLNCSLFGQYSYLHLYLRKKRNTCGNIHSQFTSPIQMFPRIRTGFIPWWNLLIAVPAHWQSWTLGWIFSFKWGHNLSF